MSHTKVLYTGTVPPFPFCAECSWPDEPTEYYAEIHVDLMLSERDERNAELVAALRDEIDDHQPEAGSRGRCRCGAALPCSERAKIERLVAES